MRSSVRSSSDPEPFGGGGWAQGASVESLAFVAVVALQALPLLFFRYFPNWDGPAHVGAAAVIARYDSPAATAFRQYFVLEPFP